MSTKLFPVVLSCFVAITGCSFSAGFATSTSTAAPEPPRKEASADGKRRRKQADARKRKKKKEDERQSVKRRSVERRGGYIVETFPTRKKPGALAQRTTVRSSMFAAGQSSSEVGKLELRFIDVGQGDTTAIKCPNGNVIVVDAGGSENPSAQAPPASFKLGSDNPKASAAKQKLDELIGQGPIEAVFLTHPDRDHYNGLGTLLDVGVSVKHIIIGGKKEEYKAKEPADWLAARAAVIEEATNKPQVDCGATEINVYSKSKGNRNTRSLVIVLSHGEADFVLPGDATTSSKQHILDTLADQAPMALDAEVLKLAHHGADNTLHVGWMKTVKPMIGVISAMKGHKYGHPRKAVVQALLDVPVAEAEAHPVSFHDGQSCKELAKKGPEDVEDCPAERWKTKEYDKAVFSLGDIGTLVMTSDGETITTSYLETQEESSTRAKTETPQEGGQSLDDAELNAACSQRCGADTKPCTSQAQGANGKYKIRCYHEKANEKSYNACLALSMPGRETWSQCTK